jgi:hypothetical protein
MLKIKYNFIRDFKDKTIKIPIDNKNSFIKDEFIFNSYIEKVKTESINEIIDGDFSIYKNLNDNDISFYFSGSTSINDIGFENNQYPYAKKSFFLLEVFDKINPNVRNKIFNYYIPYIPINDFVYDNISDIEIPNNIVNDIYYGKFTFFNSKNGEIYQFSHSQIISSQEDILFDIHINKEDKTFEFTKFNFYNIDANTYNNTYKNTLNIKQNKLPTYPIGDSFIVNKDNIEFD